MERHCPHERRAKCFMIKHDYAEISKSRFAAFQFREEIEGVPPFDVMDDSSIDIIELSSDFERSALNI
jgi:hypothetical protein